MGMMRRWSACGLASALLLATGCAAGAAGPTGVGGERLIGQPGPRIENCAAPALRRIPRNGSTLLVYYREAAIFEESFVGGKGSKAGYHHGCWATLLLEQDRVAGVEFRPVPDPEADTHECQEIFAACGS